MANFPLQLVISAVDKATAPLRRLNSRIANVSRTTLSVGKGMTAAVSAPLVALGGVGVAAFARFQSQLANISTLVDTSRENMDALGAQVMAVARRTPVAIEDLTSALYDIRSAGFGASDQMRILEGSARLAVAGLGTTAEATDIATSAINAFGLTGAEQTRAFELLFQTVKAGKTTVSGLAQGFGAVAGTVAAAGVKLDEYLASVAALTTTGLPAAQAHTQLRAVIAGLTRDTKESAEVFGKLGVKSFKQLVDASGGMVPALDRIKAALGGDEARMLKLLGSTEALNAALGLTGRQAGAFGSTLEAMRGPAGALNEAFEKQSRTSAAAMQRLRNTLEAVAVSLGRILVPVLERLAPILERLADRWTAMSPEGQKLIVVLGGIAAAIGPTLAVLSQLIMIGGGAKTAVVWLARVLVTTLLPSIAAAVSAVWSFTVALLANPIGLIVALVALLAAGIYLVYRNWAPISAWFVKMWGRIKAAAAPVIEWVWEALKKWTPVGLIVENWEPIAAFFSTLWEGIVSTFRWAWGIIEPIVDAVSSVFEGDKLGQLGAPTAAKLVAPSVAGVKSTSEARVTVAFDRLPQGARVAADRGSTAPLSLDVGYAMGGG